MIIAVIDGMGGGVGGQIVDRLKSIQNDDVEIIVLGTNSQATANMLKRGASRGASGENAIATMSRKADIIIGPVAIIAANSMMGEISPKMAEAIADCDARKILLPLSKCNIDIVGLKKCQLKGIFDELSETIKQILEE